MNIKSMALDYIKRAKRFLLEGTAAFEDGDYPVAVRRAAECVELSLKAALRSIGVEYPREHDVSRALEVVGDRFPEWFSAKIPKFMEISRELSKKRGPAMYGYEASFTPASEIFDRKDAENAITSARDVFESCERLIKMLFK
jgi:HEPN domain-containing protein